MRDSAAEHVWCIAFQYSTWTTQRQCAPAVWDNLDQQIIDKSTDHWCDRLKAVVWLNVRYTEQLFWLPTLCLKKSSHLYTLCNFVRSWPIFKVYALLKNLWNLPQKPYITNPTLGRLLHYLGKLKKAFFVNIQQTWKKMQTCILSAPILIPRCV